jgi:adenylate cyclase
VAEEVERRLTTILFADVARYSRLMERDEEGALSSLVRCRAVVDSLIRNHRGRIANTAGDAVLAEFPSVADSLLCALNMQSAIENEDPGLPPERQMRFRIGLHLGDVLVKGGDLFGDAVNIAARLASLAEPGGICVSRVVRDQVRDKLDVGFEDLGEQSLKNIARPMRVYRARLEKVAAATPVLALPDKPSIAVLPFANLSGDPEQDYFADGMVEEIITALSRIRWLFVIARNSSFTYKGQSVDVKRVGRELGVRYVLEGSVRKAGGRVRITGQLVEAESGAHLWADRFDGSLEDVFDLQDKVALSVAGVIEPTVQAAETRRSLQRPTADLTASTCICKPCRRRCRGKGIGSWPLSLSSTKRSRVIPFMRRRLRGRPGAAT